MINTAILPIEEYTKLKEDQERFLKLKEEYREFKIKVDKKSIIYIIKNMLPFYKEENLIYKIATDQDAIEILARELQETKSQLNNEKDINGLMQKEIIKIRTNGIRIFGLFFIKNSLLYGH